jgi:ABC-type uncharacterized transport system permease subunit
MRVSASVLGAIVIAWAISIIAACIFQCRPVKKAWNPQVEGFCINLKGSFIANAISNILTDIAVLTLPIRQVWKLVPTLQLRLELLVVFSLGGLYVFCSITVLT